MVTIRKDLRLDLSNIPESDIVEAKKEVGGLLTNEVLRHMELGKSPVEGEPKWPKLEGDYAKEEHNGNTKPTLSLYGDLRESIGFISTSSGVQVGVMEESQQEKADGHCNFSGKATPDKGFKRRRFIPDENQNFKQEIMDKVDRVLSSYRVDEPQTNQVEIPLELPSVPAASIAATARIDRVLREYSFQDNGLEAISETDLEKFLKRLIG